MAISPRQIGDALVLTLPNVVSEVSPGLLARTLAAAVVPTATLVVLDLRGVGLVSVHTARTLIAFAGGCAARGVECVLVPDPASTAVSVVLDVIDPNGAVPRFGTLDQALAGHAGTTPPVTRPLGSVVDRRSFADTDLKVLQKLLSTSYAPMRIGCAAGRAQVRLTRLAAGEISVDELDVGFGMTYDVGPMGRVCLVDVESGAVADHLVRGQREPEAFGPGELFSFAPPDLPVSGRISNARARVTLLTPDLFSQVTGHDRGFRLLSHRPFDAVAGGRLRAAITHVRDTVLAASDADLLLVSTANRYLAATVLRTFPNTVLSPPGAADEHDAHLQTLRRAMAFIESNADRDISAADIATAACVTVRAVQLSFRRHLGTTPMAYLRRVRLDGARTELQASDPGASTVTRIGARWGFSRASTFAAQYRVAYGETPSRTLRDDT
ncbi:helix-turn-helix domain-containing protein [Lentzea cavernae]|uniref:helix-turn-helix domain-containing protein n=1 Tax=Lentzea cavernae TaxID=2020703 RepID=UPI001E2E89D7|nr:AraC family transcriptional regulator [Lentzea cavernae]